jgi:CheY-like chemotaxis protein
VLDSVLPKEPQRQIFLVDDCAELQELFGLLAEQNNFNLITASNGKEALETLASLEIDPAVIFVDLNMPVMDGAEFIEKVHQHRLASSSRIVILSGAEREPPQSLDKPLVWLAKPFNLAEVLKEIAP